MCGCTAGDQSCSACTLNNLQSLGTNAGNGQIAKMLHCSSHASGYLHAYTLTLPTLQLFWKKDEEARLTGKVACDDRQLTA